MQVNITARHLKLTPAISDYVQRKLDKTKRYLDNLIWAQVILDVEKTRHIAEIVIHTTGRTFMAKEESTDLYAAVDLASDTIDEQLRRYKERRRGHRGKGHGRIRDRGSKWILPEPLLVLDQGERRVSSMRAQRLIELSIQEAITAMEQSDTAHWIFVNRDNQRVTVVYRKPDKTYGLVESVS
jgi:putative sigma-54 modulation protein